MPWILWRLDVALGRRSWLAAAQAGALWGLSALSGYPAFTMATGGFCALWALGRALTAHEKADGASGPLANRVGRAVAAVTVLAGIGLLVLAPTYLSFFVDGAGYHQLRVERIDPGWQRRPATRLLRSPRHHWESPQASRARSRAPRRRTPAR